MTTQMKTEPKKAVQNNGDRLVLSLSSVKKFRGFKYTVEEGKKLARRSRTEMPEFADIAREK